MAMSYFSVGLVELMVLLSGGGVLGLPPGERDDNLLRCAPTNSVFYFEWAERSAGKLGAPGIDGLAADPEIRQFLADVEKAIIKSIQTQTEAHGDPAEQILGQQLPPLIKLLLNRPGCLSISMENQVAQNPADVPKWLGAMVGLKAALVVNGGKDADKIAGHLSELVKLLPPEMRTERLQKQPLPFPMPGTKLTLHRHQNYFIIGLGEETVEVIVERLAGKSKGLSGNKRFSAAMKKIEAERISGVSWIDLKSTLERVSTSMGVAGAMINSMAITVGANALDSIASTTAVVDGKIQRRTYITTGGRTDGILSLASGRAIRWEDLALAPADSDCLFALSLNAPKILATVKDIVGKASPESLQTLEGLIAQLEDELGTSFENDVFKGFGDVWVFHNSPAAGGLFLTSLVGGLEVQNKQKSKQVFTQLMSVLEKALPGEIQGGFRRKSVSLSKIVFLNQTIYFVNSIGDDDVPFAPAFCLTDKQLLVAPHPQALKAHLRFLSGNEANFASRKKEFSLPEGDLICFSHFDTKKLVEQLYAFTPYVAQILFSEIQRGGVEINIASLPSARGILPYLSSSYSSVVRTKNGLRFESSNSLPLPGGFGLLVNLPVLGFMTVMPRRRVEIQRARILNNEMKKALQAKRQKVKRAAQNVQRAKPIPKKPPRKRDQKKVLHSKTPG